MRNSNSPPDFGAQASPAATRAGQGMGGNQNALLEMLQQRRQQMQQQGQPQQQTGMGGLGQMGRAMFDKMRERQQGGMAAPPMLQPAVEPGGQGISEPQTGGGGFNAWGQPADNGASVSQPPTMPSQPPPQQQTGMAGLGQMGRAGFDKMMQARALRRGGMSQE
jgi:hypothetical protein